VEAVSSSEKLISIYQTTPRNILEDGHIHIHHRENLKSHQNKSVFALKIGIMNSVNYDFSGKLSEEPEGPRLIDI
jgi:hypothetical protein